MTNESMGKKRKAHIEIKIAFEFFFCKCEISFLKDSSELKRLLFKNNRWKTRNCFFLIIKVWHFYVSCAREYMTLHCITLKGWIFAKISFLTFECLKKCTGICKLRGNEKW